MKEKKFIVVVEFEDGTRQEYISYDEKVSRGMSFKGGKIVAVRKLTTKFCE